MLVSLCVSFTTSASADANVTTVTMAKGDTVLGLCQKLGVDYYTYKNLIMTLNGFTAESQFNGLAVDSDIVLPTSNTAAQALLKGAASTMSGTAGTTAPAAAAQTASAGTYLSSGNPSTIPAGDYVSYYLVNYDIKSGQTIGGIYSNWGLSYKTYEKQILKLNGLSGFNSIAAGKNLLLPTTNPALANSAYYTVMGHVIKSGETAYDIICRDYGLNLGSVQNMVLAINNITNLNSLTAGATLYIPVPGIVSASSTVSPSNAATTTTATVNTSANYNLVAQASVNGSFDLTVDGKSATTAQAGKTVYITATPDLGYIVDSIRVVKVGDSSVSVAVNNNSFVMPSYSVIVSVTFRQTVAYNITVDAAEHGTVAAMVNGMSVTKGYAGSAVIVRAIPKPGFMLDNVRVTYNNYKDSVAVQNNQFIMPATGVNITASFVADPNYDPNAGCAVYVDANFCSYRTLVGDKEVQYAKQGEVVKLDIAPYTNYTVESIKVYNSDFTKILATDKLSFTMPDAPVNVVITVKPTPNAEFAVNVVDPVNGTVAVLVDDKPVKSAKVGQTVLVKPTESKPAYNSIVTVFKTSDSSVSVPVTENADGTVSFAMPDFAVTVRVKFYTYYNVMTHASNGQYGYYGVVWAQNQSMAVSKAAAGVELKVGFSQIKPGYSVSEILLVYADGSTYTLDGTNFIMPDCDVTVRVKFAPSATIRAYAITENDTDKSGVYPCWGNTYTIGGKTLNDIKASYIDISAASTGKVTVTPNAAIGSVFDKIVYTYRNTSDILTSGVVKDKDPTTQKYQIEMPADMKAGSLLEVHVYFKEIKTYSINHDYTNNGTDQSNADHGRGTYSFITSYDNADHAAVDTKIYIRSEACAGFKADLDGVKIYRASDGLDVTMDKDVNYDKINYSFFMPAYDVNVYVPFTETVFWVKLEKSIAPNGQVRGELTAIIGNTHFTEETMTLTGYGKNHLRTVFETGTQVKLVNTSVTGYTLRSDKPFSIFRADGSGMATGEDLANSLMLDGSIDTFILPNFNVIVRANYDDEVVNVIAEASEHGSVKVPSQVAWSAPFTVTEVNPDIGYELSMILVSYIDCNGVPHKDEPVAVPSNTVVIAGGGKPQSDVTVKAVFTAVKNTLSIKYLFAGAPVDTEFDYYNVNLTRYVETGDGSVTIRRDETNPWSSGKRTDTVLPENGIPTGSYVRVSRSTVHYDQNFFIAAVTVTNNGAPVDVVTDGENFYFYMPYADSNDCVVTVYYSNIMDGSFYLSSKSVGSEAIKDVKFKAYDGIDWASSPDITMAKPGTKIGAKIIGLPTLETNQKLRVFAVYTDNDNVNHRDEITDAKEYDYYTFTLTGTPVPPTVSIEYVIETVYELTYSEGGSQASGSSAEFYVDGNPVASGSKVVAGKTVTVKPVSSAAQNGYAPSSIDINGVTQDSFEFVMPAASTVVKVNYVKAMAIMVEEDALNKSSYSITSASFGTRVDTLQYANNGDTVSVTVTPDSGYIMDYSALAVIDDGGSTLTCTTVPDGNAVTITFTMGTKNVTVTGIVFSKTTAKVNFEYAAESLYDKCEFYLNDSTTKMDSGTSTAGVNDVISIRSHEGYIVNNVSVSYTAADGSAGTVNLDTVNETITLTSVPGSDITVRLKLVPDGTKTFAITKDVTLPDPTKYANATSMDITGGLQSDGKALANAYVSVLIKVRYDLKYVDKSLALNYRDANGKDVSKKVDNVWGGNFDSTGMVKEYHAFFYMPDADTTVSFETKEADSFTVNNRENVAGIFEDAAKTKVLNSGKIGDDFYVMPVAPAPGYQLKSVTVFYSIFDSEKSEESKEASKSFDRSAAYDPVTNLFRISVPESSINNTVKIVVNYELIP